MRRSTTVSFHRFLVVGDPHARVSDLDDVQKLVDFALQVAISNKAEILFLGDQYHYHGILHAEVMHFWHTFFERCVSESVNVVALLGNHDKPGVLGSAAHSMIAHLGQIHVVTAPEIRNGVLFVPYCTHDELLGAARANSVPTIVCHATFNGNKYEGGMYAKDGLDPDLLPQEQIVSGHVHKPQAFGKVWNPGAPRALTRADANERRAIWLVDFENGRVVGRTPLYLDGVTQQVYAYDDRPEAPLEVQFDPTHKYYVDIHGPSSWIEERKPLYVGKAKVRTFRTDKPQIKLKESEGIAVAFKKFFSSYKPRFGTSPEVLRSMFGDRGVVV